MSSIQLQQSLRDHLIHKILEVCINLYANLFGSHAIISKFLPLHQMTPLHLAAKRGHLKIIRCLVGAKGTVNVQDKKGVNAFHGITDLLSWVSLILRQVWKGILCAVIFSAFEAFGSTHKVFIPIAAGSDEDENAPTVRNLFTYTLVVCYILTKPEISVNFWLTLANNAQLVL